MGGPEGGSLGHYRFAVGPEATGQRLDAFLAARAELGLSRSHVRKLIDQGMVTVGGQPTKPGHRLTPGEEVAISVPPARDAALLPQDIALDILYEDGDVIVINKPRGMVVHPAAGHSEGTLVNALLHHCKDLSGINNTLRPGIVHRLDKDTTGVMMAAKNDEAHRSLSNQIKSRMVKREYLAIVHGSPRVDAGKVEAPIGRDPLDRKRMAVNVPHGRFAATHFRVIERFGDYSLLSCRLETGRTHQVRVHLASIGNPVFGDPVYGPRRRHFPLGGQALHARLLGFHHPRDGRWMEFTAPPPADFQAVLEELRRGGGG